MHILELCVSIDFSGSPMHIEGRVVSMCLVEDDCFVCVPIVSAVAYLGSRRQHSPEELGIYLQCWALTQSRSSLCSCCSISCGDFFISPLPRSSPAYVQGPPQ